MFTHRLEMVALHSGHSGHTARLRWIQPRQKMWLQGVLMGWRSESMLRWKRGGEIVERREAAKDEQMSRSAALKR